MITLDKLRNLNACLQLDHYTASASNGLLSRAVRLQYGHTRPDQYLQLNPVKGATYYMKSILEWGREMGCYLCKFGYRPEQPTLDVTLANYLSPTPTQQETQKLRRTPHQYVGEIVHESDAGRTWRIPRNLEWTRHKLPTQVPTDKRMLFRAGQYWREERNKYSSKVGKRM